jgi:hypothetical protein
MEFDIDGSLPQSLVDDVFKVLTKSRGKKLREALSKLNLVELKHVAKILKQELTFSFSKMKKPELLDNLVDHLLENEGRMKGIIRAVYEGKTDEY